MDCHSEAHFGLQQGNISIPVLRNGNHCLDWVQECQGRYSEGNTPLYDSGHTRERIPDSPKVPQRLRLESSSHGQDLDQPTLNGKVPYLWVFSQYGKGVDLLTGSFHLLVDLTHLNSLCTRQMDHRDNHQLG